MNAHQFAVNFTHGMTLVGLPTIALYCWAGCVRLARRIGN